MPANGARGKKKRTGSKEQQTLDWTEFSRPKKKDVDEFFRPKKGKPGMLKRERMRDIMAKDVDTTVKDMMFSFWEKRGAGDGDEAKAIAEALQGAGHREYLAMVQSEDMNNGNNVTVAKVTSSEFEPGRSRSEEILGCVEWPRPEEDDMPEDNASDLVGVTKTYGTGPEAMDEYLLDIEWDVRRREQGRDVSGEVSKNDYWGCAMGECSPKNVVMKKNEACPECLKQIGEEKAWDEKKRAVRDGVLAKLAENQTHTLDEIFTVKEYFDMINGYLTVGEITRLRVGSEGFAAWIECLHTNIHGEISKAKKLCWEHWAKNRFEDKWEEAERAHEMRKEADFWCRYRDMRDDYLDMGFPFRDAETLAMMYADRTVLDRDSGCPPEIGMNRGCSCEDCGVRCLLDI